MAQVPQYSPMQFNFSDPERLKKLALQMDPQVGQFLLSQVPQTPTVEPTPYSDMLSPEGVQLSPETQQSLQSRFDSGAQANAESGVPLESFGGSGPTQGGMLNWAALLGAANMAAQASQRPQAQPQFAFATPPQNQWKGFQAQQIPVGGAQRKRAGSLAQILGM